MIRKTRASAPRGHCVSNPGKVCSARKRTMSKTDRKLPKWLAWSVVTIVLWGTWGLVSKVASAGMDAYLNQLLYTAGLAPLLVFVALAVHRRSAHEKREGRAQGV